MRKFYLLLLTMLSFLVVPSNGSMKALDFNKVVKMVKSEFPLTKHDVLLLDELNTMRSIIAKGTIADAVAFLEGIVKAIGEAVKWVSDGIEQLWDDIKDIGKKVYKFAKDTTKWGAEFLINTSDVLVDAALTIEDALSDLGEDIVDTFSDIGNAIGNFFGKRRRRKNVVLNRIPRNQNKTGGSNINLALNNTEMPSKFNVGIPKNTLGPASNMNILTWNRRLAQLAAANGKKFDSDERTIEYNGKQYRMFAFGGYMEYIAANFLGEYIASLFKYAKLGYMACYLVLCGIDAPIYDLSAIKDTYFEALYANRVEIGCVVRTPASFCIIGPIIETTDGMLYKKNRSCVDCFHGCDKKAGLCLPPPSYFFALRDKYEARLRPKISKFEIVEGFNISANSSEYSVEWPMDDNSSVYNCSIITIISFLLAMILF